MAKFRIKSVLKDGYKWCPHCSGYTTCNCGSCGVKIPYTSYDGKQEVRIEEGICKVCNGTGQIPK
jgi:hypothetical protein